MRGRLLRKNVMKDYFIRTYAVALVIIAFLLFLDTVVFILARGVLLSGERATITLRYFSFMGGNLIMAIVFPAVMFWVLFGGWFDRGAGDLYQSLPPARNEMFASAVCVITGYEGVFLLLQMILRMILIATTKGFRVRKYFYWSVTGLSFSLYLVFLAVAILCFCASASALGFFGRFGLWTALLWVIKDGVNVLFFVRQMIFYETELNVSGTIPVKLENTFSNVESRILFEEYDLELGTEAWELRISRDSGLFLAILGVGLLFVSWIAFRKRPAERTNGRNRSELMHTILQAATFATCLISSGLVLNAYEYNRIWMFMKNSQNGQLAFSILKRGVLYGIPLILLLCVWEFLYRKKIREVPKVWKSIVSGVVICLLAVVFTMCVKL